MTSIIQKLNRNPIFKYCSSIRLAVPLMLIMAIAVSYGTIIESQYNADMARLKVYQAFWFEILLGFLWLNIFCATVSRIPFKKHHTGFVITHIGLLTLLIGSLVTSEKGIDGQLRVVEGTRNNVVFLPELALSVRARESAFGRDFVMGRSGSEKKSDHFKKINQDIADIFQVTRYLPYVNSSRIYRETANQDAGTGIGFILKSQFFNVSEWLHTRDNPEMKMGPATLRILGSRPKTKKVAKKAAPASAPKKAAGGSPRLIILSATNGKTLGTFPISDLKKRPTTIQDAEVSVKNSFKQAVVGKGGLVEGPGDKPNPALEIEVKNQGKAIREVAFAKFPEFALNPNGAHGLKFQYVSGETPAPEVGEPTAQGNTHNHDHPVNLSRDGNVVEFYVSKETPQDVVVELYKNNVLVMTQKATSGTTIQTPWMGMTIGIGNVLANAEISEEVTAIEPPLRSEMPPSALFIQPAASDTGQSFWIREGDVKTFMARGKAYEIYYGRRSLNLPFSLHLEKFSKVDYPGTEMAMSFESDVRVNEDPGLTKISMNEPMKKDGFTVYQSSYEMNPGGPAASIFSINQDPGRPIKYAGSLILSIGIIVFTLMRSRMARPTKK